MGPARPLQVTCTVEVPRWLASSLRHSPPLRASTLDHRTQPSRLGAQREGTRSSNTTEQQQSPDQKSSTSAQKTTTNQRHEAPPKTHTHEETTTRRKAPRRSTKPPKDHEDETTKRPPKTKPPKDEEHHDVPRSHQKTTKPPKDKTSTWRPVRPFITQVPTLRSSPFSAAPPFQLLREASRKGAFLRSQRLIPRTDQWRTICLALPPHQARRKIGGKNPRTIGGFFSRPFHSRF